MAAAPHSPGAPGPARAVPAAARTQGRSGPCSPWPGPPMGEERARRGRPRSGGDAPDPGGTDITAPHREIPRSAQAGALHPRGGGCSARPTLASLGRRRAPHLCGPPFFPAKGLRGVVAIPETPTAPGLYCRDGGGGERAAGEGTSSRNPFPPFPH